MTKPSIQSIIDKQKIAHYRLTKNTTTRTIPELTFYERTLTPVPLENVELPKLPLVRLIENHDKKYILLGEITQIPGKIILTENINKLEIIPPA